MVGSGGRDEQRVRSWAVVFGLQWGYGRINASDDGWQWAQRDQRDVAQ